MTLIGKKTGGGACVVVHLSTVGGALFGLSSTSSNGPFCSADPGIQVGSVITQTEKFCDRSALAEHLGGLLRQQSYRQRRAFRQLGQNAEARGN